MQKGGRRGQGGKPGEHPDVSNVGQQITDEPATQQEADVIAGQRDSDGQGREILDGGADSQQGSSQAITHPQEAHRRKKRGEVFHCVTGGQSCGGW